MFTYNIKPNKIYKIYSSKTIITLKSDLELIEFVCKEAFKEKRIKLSITWASEAKAYLKSNFSLLFLMTQSQQTKLMIIENFIDYNEKDETERLKLKMRAFDYVLEDHVDEIEQSGHIKY